MNIDSSTYSNKLEQRSTIDEHKTYDAYKRHKGILNKYSRNSAIVALMAEQWVDRLATLQLCKKASMVAESLFVCRLFFLCELIVPHSISLTDING